MKARIPYSAIGPILEQLESRRHLALTHQYTFNDGTANDSVGTANGTLVNSPAVTNGWVWLQNSGKLSSDTTLQYVNLPANVLPSSGSASVELWYTDSTVSAQSMHAVDFGDAATGAGNSYFYYSPRSTSNDARAVLHPAGGSERVASKTGGTYDGFSHFAAAVIDTSAGFIRLYVDGALISSTALSGASAASINNLSSYIGRSLTDTDPGFTGAIDELRIYNHALSATEVSSHYASGATRPAQTTPARQIEKLNRGIVAIRTSSTNAHISWRQLASDPIDVGFNLYRSANGGAFTKVNSTVITATSDSNNTIDGTVSNAYYVKPVINGVEQAASETFTLAANAPIRYYLNIPLNPPAGGTTPDGLAYTYNANDASVGDLDGDGQYEIILKWDSTLSKDSSQDGFTGNTYLDAYKIDGTFLWRIDEGRNIRAGAHDTQFIVYDLDGDGKSEVAIRTAPGTIDGQGNPVLMGTDKVTDDYRNATTGRINTGPEYLTIFNGLTGAQMATTAYKPDRVNIASWGDSYGNRGNRFLMAVAYVDGQRPSLICGRGLFPGQSGSVAVRNEITAWDYRNGGLSLRWWFRADNNASAYGLPNINTGYIGQGNYEMHPADVDGDGKDEIVYGSMTVDDNGTAKYTTGLGHGDAMMVSDMNPTRPGEEVYMPMESPASNGLIATNVHDANTGQVIFSTPDLGTHPDVGRGNSFDIDPRYLGFENWDSYNTNIYNVDGTVVMAKPSNMFQNFGTWWDADPLRELQDGTTIGDWRDLGAGSYGRSNFDLDPATAGTQGFAPGGASNNGTKSTPCLTADILGDWREESIWRTSDNLNLMIFTTPISATNRMTTLMHDVQYRESVAWQNVGYNQPTATSFYLGDSMPSVPRPSFYYALSTPTSLTATPVSMTQINLVWQDANTQETGFEIQRSTDGTNFTTIATVAADVLTYNNTGLAAGSTYYYRVRATGPNAPSSFSNIAPATTFTYAGAITGLVYEDRDGSATYNTGDLLMLGVNVYLDTNNNGVLDSGEPTSISSSLGYSFTNLPSGTYRVREVVPTGMARTQPTSGLYTFVVASNSYSGDFGNVPNVFNGSSGADSWYVRYRVFTQKTEIWVNSNPTTQTTPTYALSSSQATSLTFNGLVGDDSLVLDNINGDVIPTGGLVFTGGDGNDTIDLRGASSTDAYSLPAVGQIQHGADVASFTAETLKLSTGLFNASADLGAIKLESSGASTTLNLNQTESLDTLTVSSGAIVNSQSTNSAQPAMRVNAVTINGGILSIAPNGGLAGVSVFKNLSIDSTGKLNFHDNDLIVDYTGGSSPITQVRNWLKSGLTTLNGSGLSGILSNEVDQQTRSGTMLGVVDNNDISGQITSLSGYTTVPVQAVIVKYTWFGDATLDGKIDGSDYALVDSGFTSPGVGTWLLGDFDYSGVVDASDYALIDTGFIVQNQIL